MDATIFVAFNKNIELDICINHACIGKITAQHFAILKANGDKKYTMEACLGDATPENGYKSTVVFSSEPFDHFTYHEEAQTINLEMYQEVVMLEVVLFLGLGLLVSLFALIK